MVRTQIYLTEEERRRLKELAETTGKKQVDLIREAVNQFLESSSKNYRTMVLKEAAGLWQDRQDLPDFQGIRRSWDGID